MLHPVMTLLLGKKRPNTFWLMKTRSTRLFLELNSRAFFSAMFQFRLGIDVSRLGKVRLVQLG